MSTNPNSISSNKSALPLQGKNLPKGKLIGVGILMLIVIFLNYFYATKNQENLVKKENDTYDTTHLDPLTKVVSASTPTTINAQPLETAPSPIIKKDLEQEIAKAKATDFIERLQASQNEGGIRNFSQQRANEAAEGGGDIKKVPANLAGVSDPNTAFLVQSSNSKAEHVYATHYGSLPYMLGQGKFIFATLSVAINSDLPGQITATVSQDVYGDQGRKILIPRGSILIGEYKSGLVNNQSRLFVVWTRVREPNGIDAMLGSEGTDYLGRAGLTGGVDYHFMARFGAASLVALIGGAASTVGVNSKDQYNSAANYRQDLTQAFSQQSSSMLSQSLNIPPTIHVPQGEKIIVFVNRDIDFSRVLK